MGLAASQARLLSLTSRQHTVELRAQYYQAQKLRLANDSDSAYERYITALDATKYQTKFYSSDKKLHWVDASLNNLMRYDNLAQYTGNTYFVQNIDNGKLYVQQDIYDAYIESNGNIETYFKKLNINFENDVHTQEFIFAQEAVDYDEAQGWNNNQYIYEYNQLKANIASPDMSQCDEYNAAKKLLNILSVYNSVYGIYLSNNNNNYTNLTNNLATLKRTDYYTGDIKDIIDYCAGFEENVDYTNLDLGNENLEKFMAYGLHDTDDGAYIVYNKDKENSLGNELKITDDAILLRLLLNGGTCYKNDNSNSENIYGNDITSKLEEYNHETGNSEEVLSVGDALKYFCETVQNNEIAIAKENAQAALDERLENDWHMSEYDMEMRICHYDEYIQDLTILQSCNQETYRAFPGGQEIGENYELIFNAITAAGGCIAISDENAKSGAWVTNMVKNVQVILTKYNNEENDLDTISVSQNGGLREISNDEDLKRAENEYDTILDEITEKEKKYDIKLSQLEAERNAIETEKESLKQVANDNIDSTFRLFS